MSAVPKSARTQRLGSSVGSSNRCDRPNTPYRMLIVWLDALPVSSLMSTGSSIVGVLRKKLSSFTS